MATLLLNADKTILHSYSLFYPLASLKPDDALELSPSPPVLTVDPSEWKAYLHTLHRAYQRFVSLVAEEEASDPPLGIFRPGMFDVMERIQQLYQAGNIRRVILYSLYPFKPFLSFARDVLQMALCAGLSSSSSSSSSRSSSSRTLPLLPLEIANQYPHFLSDLDTDSVYLVDDQPSAILSPYKDRSLSLPPYEFKASFKRVGELYVQALRAAKINLNTVHDVNLFLFSQPSLSPTSFVPPASGSLSPEERIVSFLEQRTGPTVSAVSAVPRANGILSLFHLLERIGREEGKKEKEGGKEKEGKKEKEEKKEKEDLNPKHIRHSE